MSQCAGIGTKKPASDEAGFENEEHEGLATTADQPEKDSGRCQEKGGRLRDYGDQTRSGESGALVGGSDESISHRSIGSGGNESHAVIEKRDLRQHPISRLKVHLIHALMGRLILFRKESR